MTDDFDYAALPARFAGRRIAVIGDVMLDRRMDGRIERLSAEAPAPVMRHRRETVSPGGAGHAAASLVALGAMASLAGITGKDVEADRLGEACAAASVEAAGLIASPDRPTTVKTRFVERGRQIFRHDAETDANLSGGETERLRAAALAAMEGAHAVLLSDYAKGVFAGGLAGELIAAAKARGLPVIVDPAGGDYSRYRGADYVIPNLAGLALAAGSAVEGDEGVAAAAASVMRESGIGAMLVTRGRDGMTLVREDGVHHVRGLARDVYDVSGAGDTAAAAFTLALASGLAPETAAQIANTAAGIAVGKRGVAVVTAAELAAAGESLARPAGVATREDGLALVRRWRESSLVIGFTNGVFDLLHPGHVSLLAYARAQCDRLVVGLNTDASVKRLKGPDRPAHDEAARAAVLAALESVDLVIPFAEDTPAGLLAALKPDVYVKGADYRVEDLPGADAVIAAGGRVLLADLVPGRSTTAILDRLKR